ncbi:MAG: alpha/beta hydrolase family protein [Opitutaceae bacterium]
MPLVVRIQSPPEGRLAAKPLLLLYFSTDRQSSLPDGRYGEPGGLFLERGHRVASFDLPAHGERVDRHGSGIEGLCARMVAGGNPFDLFVADGRAVIDECIRRGLAEEGRIVACGVSRGGYCAVRLAAAEPRISAVAALAPVTDWRSLREFSAVKDGPEVSALALSRYAESLAGRRLYVATGNHDLRVGTDACTRFVLAVGEAERRFGVEKSGVRYLLVDDSSGHALAAKWRQEGVLFLLENTTKGDAAPTP